MITTTAADLTSEQLFIDQLLMQYRELEEEKDKRQTEKENDVQILEWTEKLLKLRDISKKLTEAIIERGNSFGVEEISAKQDELKAQIKQVWPDPTRKTYASSIGITATLRTTRALIVDSQKAVVDFLVKNDKVEEGIKSFNLMALRKFADAGLLNEGATHYEEKQSVAIKLNSTEKEE